MWPDWTTGPYHPPPADLPPQTIAAACRATSATSRLRTTTCSITSSTTHLARLEAAYKTVRAETPATLDAVFLSAPGPISNLVEMQNGVLELKSNPRYLKNHPLAAQHDFEGWFDLCSRRYKEIEAQHGLSLDGFSAVVLVSFQLFSPEVWLPSALALQRGEISRQTWDLTTDQTCHLHHGFQRSRHFVLLQHLKDSAVSCPPVYSVATPARSETADFPSNSLRPDENIGQTAFRTAEEAYAQRIKEWFGAKMLRYPDTLLAPNGMTTSRKFQQHATDFTHLNNEGSHLLLESILQQITPVS